MSRSPFLKRLAGDRAPPTPDKAPDASASHRDRPGYVFPEERAKALFKELYPSEDPADYPRAVYAIVRSLREVEDGAVAFAERALFQKGAEAATRHVLDLIKDPATCIDPVTRQPTASHFDWRNITNLLIERITALSIQPPR